MPEIGVIGTTQARFQARASQRAEHLQDVSERLDHVATRLAARGHEEAAGNVSNAADRIAARAASIGRAVAAHVADAMPPVVSSESGADSDGKGALIDLIA